MRRTVVSGIFTVALAPGSVALAQDGPPAIREGLPFPEIVLPDMETGQARSIVDFRGQKLILEIFASW